MPVHSIEPSSKLLKVLEEKRFRKLGEVRERLADVRLISATHQDLGVLAREKKFRSDLYFRIGTLPLTVPPLRERVEDIPLLSEVLLGRIASDLNKGRIGIATDAVETLQNYRWPGNVRELRNVLERAALLSGKDVIGRADLRFEALGAVESVTNDSDLTLAQVETRHIERALRMVNWKVEEAAERLGIPRSPLYQKIKLYGLSKA